MMAATDAHAWVHLSIKYVLASNQTQKSSEPEPDSLDIVPRDANLLQSVDIFEGCYQVLGTPSPGSNAKVRYLECRKPVTSDERCVIDLQAGCLDLSLLCKGGCLPGCQPATGD